MVGRLSDVGEYLPFYLAAASGEGPGTGTGPARERRRRGPVEGAKSFAAS
jgi:hypothetical protein